MWTMSQRSVLPKASALKLSSPAGMQEEQGGEGQRGQDEEGACRGGAGHEVTGASSGRMVKGVAAAVLARDRGVRPVGQAPQDQRGAGDRDGGGGGEADAERVGEGPAGGVGQLAACGPADALGRAWAAPIDSPAAAGASDMSASRTRCR